VNDEQYAALQGKAKYGWLRAVLAVAYNFGLRKGELLGLRVSQIDLKARTIHLLPGTTKRQGSRRGDDRRCLQASWGMREG
jgi:integrase